MLYLNFFVTYFVCIREKCGDDADGEYFALHITIKHWKFVLCDLNEHASQLGPAEGILIDRVLGLN